MINILYLLGGFILGWIIGSIVRIIKNKRKCMPLMTPEEKYMYKQLQNTMDIITKQVRMYEELIDDTKTRPNKKVHRR